MPGFWDRLCSGHAHTWARVRAIAAPVSSAEIRDAERDDAGSPTIRDGEAAEAARLALLRATERDKATRKG